MRLSVFILILFQATVAVASEVRVAVASNFLSTIRQLEPVFEETSRHQLEIISGSTGKLYAQIRHGAPFDIMLAADRERPKRLEAAGLAVAGQRFTYALGRLSLWSPVPAPSADDCLRRLLDGEFSRLAIANPRTAPYGAAARTVLQRLGIWDRYRSQVVQGENISQTLQFVASGNAQIGLVAQSQVVNGSELPAGCLWNVPPEYYQALDQQAVLLERGADNAGAISFIDFLRSSRAQLIIAHNGYGLP